MAIQIAGSTIIDNSRNIVSAGIVTATSFSGNGSNLTGIVANAVNGFSVYTSPGTFTVGTDCPSSITSIVIYACGGGGPGSIASPPTTPAGGGGGASQTGCYFIPTSNGQVFSITIGGASGTTTVSRSGITSVSIPGGTAGSTGSRQGGLAGSTDPRANFHLAGGHGGHGSSHTNPPSPILDINGHGGNSFFGTGGRGGISFSPTPLPSTAGSGAGSGGGGNGAAGAPGQVVITF